jgi:hypothetical protein
LNLIWTSQEKTRAEPENKARRADMIVEKPVLNTETKPEGLI